MLHETPGAMRMRFLSGDEYPESAIPEFEAAIKEVEELSGGGGYLYEVELDDALIDRMLDWDAPLSEQPESVREALSSARARFEAGGTEVDLAAASAIEQGLRGDAGLTGETLHRQLVQSAGSDQAAADYLRGLGIPGLEYPAGSLSGVEDSTARNFVIWDEQSMRILEKYGMAGAAIGVTAVAANRDEDGI